MSAGIILLAAIVCAFVAAAVSLGVVLYLSEDTTDVEYVPTARDWWAANTAADFDHDAVQLAADQGCEIEPRDLVRDGLGGQS